jgi:hypothetical protein
MSLAPGLVTVYFKVLVQQGEAVQGAASPVQLPLKVNGPTLGSSPALRVETPEATFMAPAGQIATPITLLPAGSARCWRERSLVSRRSACRHPRGSAPERPAAGCNRHQARACAWSRRSALDTRAQGSNSTQVRAMASAAASSARCEHRQRRRSQRTKREGEPSLRWAMPAQSGRRHCQ